MGTSYRIYENKEDNIEFYIHEMSNRLELSAEVNGVLTFEAIQTKEMEPIEMLRILMKGITAVSYWMGEAQFKKAFAELEVFPF